MGSHLTAMMVRVLVVGMSVAFAGQLMGKDGGERMAPQGAAFSLGAGQEMVVPSGDVKDKDGMEQKRMRLIARAEARWGALVKKDFVTAYGFSVPSYRRLYPVAYFTRKYNAKAPWVGYELKEARVQEGRGEVELDLQSELPVPPSPKTITTRAEERWYWQEGEWWYVGDGRSVAAKGESGEVDASGEGASSEQPSDKASRSAEQAEESR